MYALLWKNVKAYKHIHGAVGYVKGVAERGRITYLTTVPSY